MGRSGEVMGHNTLLGEFTLTVLYAIAVVSGALGGCAAGIYYSQRSRRMFTFALFVAYTILGLMFGVVVFAGAMVAGYKLGTVHELVLHSLVGGFAGSLALFSANWTVKALFQRFGIEVEIQLRKTKKD